MMPQMLTAAGWNCLPFPAFVILCQWYVTKQVSNTHIFCISAVHDKLLWACTAKICWTFRKSGTCKEKIWFKSKNPDFLYLKNLIFVYLKKSVFFQPCMHCKNATHTDRCRSRVGPIQLWTDPEQKQKLDRFRFELELECKELNSVMWYRTLFVNMNSLTSCAVSVIVRQRSTPMRRSSLRWALNKRSWRPVLRLSTCWLHTQRVARLVS